MTAWLARAGFVLMWAGAFCLLVEAVVVVLVPDERAGLAYLGWAVATFVLVLVGAAAVLTAAERRRRGR